MQDWALRWFFFLRDPNEQKIVTEDSFISHETWPGQKCAAFCTVICQASIKFKHPWAFPCRYLALWHKETISFVCNCNTRNLPFSLLNIKMAFPDSIKHNLTSSKLNFLYFLNLLLSVMTSKLVQFKYCL